MIERLVTAGDGRVARVRFTDRHDGDFRIDGPPERLAEIRRSVAAGPWTWMRQVHGAEVVEVSQPGACAGVEADAAVTATVGAVLAVQTADCAPVVMVGDGAVAVAHVGWRGLVAGVVPAAVATLRTRATGDIRAYIGPVIRPGRYEFGEDDLATVIAAVGETARSTSDDGRPALDLAAATTRSLEGAGAAEVHDLGLDTSDPDYFSHRCRGDTGRQVSTVWLETT